MIPVVTDVVAPPRTAACQGIRFVSLTINGFTVI